MILDKVTAVPDNAIITQTRQWIEQVVIGLNFCPFARHVFDKSLIAYQVANNQNIEDDLVSLITLCATLEQNSELETGFVIYPKNYADFDDYLDLLALANQLLIEQDYEGVFQLASFHPQYCFEETASDAAENYTNRSPYPMLHLLREHSLEKALVNYSDPEEIPVRNIEVAKQKGVEFFCDILKNIHYV